jgi:hypothetical protein
VRHDAGRRRLVGLLAALAGAGLTTRVAGESGPRAESVRTTIAAAEARLARGDAVEALQLFERAAAAEHAADIEAGIVRCHLQAGEFGRALAFAAHTAGAHGSDAGGTVLYVWMLVLCGQATFGERLLGQARARLPGDPLLAGLQAQLASGAPVPWAGTDVAPLRLAPYGVGDAVPATARLVSSGALLEPDRALMPSAALAGATRLWVRDGLGRTVEVVRDRELAAGDLIALRLGRALGGTDAGPLPVAPSDAFPGSPACASGYAAAVAEMKPAWPWLRQGFLGAVAGDGHERRLGIELPTHVLAGGPVLDLSGRLVGVTQGSGGGVAAAMLPVSSLRAGLAPPVPAPTTAPAPPRLATEALYERAMRATLQVLAVP